jgi:hypothetical protein
VDNATPCRIAVRQPACRNDERHRRARTPSNASAARSTAIGAPADFRFYSERENDGAQPAAHGRGSSAAIFRRSSNGCRRLGMIRIGPADRVHEGAKAGSSTRRTTRVSRLVVRRRRHDRARATDLIRIRTGCSRRGSRREHSHGPVTISLEMTSLEDREVHGWCRPTAPDEFRHYTRILGAEERARCARFRFEPHRYDYANAHDLLRRSLSLRTHGAGSMAVREYPPRQTVHPR